MRKRWMWNAPIVTTAHDSIHFYLDELPSHLTIDSPAEGDLLKWGNVGIVGQVEDDIGPEYINIKVDGINKGTVRGFRRGEEGFGVIII